MKHFPVRQLFWVLMALSSVPALASGAEEPEDFKVGRQRDGSIVVPTNQVLRPAGQQITFPGRPVDLLLIEDGQTLVVKNLRDLVFIDVATAKIKQTLELDRGLGPEPVFEIKDLVARPIGPDGKPKAPYADGFSVVGLAALPGRIFVSDALNRLHVAERKKDGRYRWGAAIELFPPKVGGYANPAGVAFQSKDEAWVTTTRGNNVQLVNLSDGPGRAGGGGRRRSVHRSSPVRIAVTSATGAATRRRKAIRRPSRPARRSASIRRPASPITAPSRSSRAEPGHWKQVKTIAVGLHPSGMIARAARRPFSTSPTPTATRSRSSTRRPTRWSRRSPAGRRPGCPSAAAANALALSPDGGTLYVANGTNNCVAVVRLGSKAFDGPAEQRPEQSTRRSA